MSEYDPAKDARDSYFAAVEAKRQRGDKHWPDKPWKRREVIGDCVLYQGDCMEILPKLGKVDAVVTDPPYGIGYDEAAHKVSGFQGGGMKAKKGVYAATNWDTAPPAKKVINLMLEISESQIVFGGNYFHLPPSRCWLVWDKKTNGGFADCELAWTNLDKPVRKIEHMWNGMLRAGGEARNAHPTQKPLGVMSWCLTHVPQAKTILDPFMGSGTTGVACVKAGRKFIGIEREPSYFDIACERIRKAYAQPDLFIKVAKAGAPKQEALFAEDGL